MNRSRKTPEKNLKKNLSNPSSRNFKTPCCSLSRVNLILGCGSYIDTSYSARKVRIALVLNSENKTINDQKCVIDVPSIMQGANLSVRE